MDEKEALTLYASERALDGVLLFYSLLFRYVIL